MSVQETVVKHQEVRAKKQQDRIPDPIEFARWAEGEALRIAGLPEGDQREALRMVEARCSGFDDLPRETKKQALKMAEPEPVNVFDPENALPSGLPVVLPDRNNWVARRSGTLEPEGCGVDQLEALLDLERKEQQKEVGTDVAECASVGKQKDYGDADHKITRGACGGNDDEYRKSDLLCTAVTIETLRLLGYECWLNGSYIKWKKIRGLSKTEKYEAAILFRSLDKQQVPVVDRLDRKIFGVSLTDAEMKQAREAWPECNCRLCREA